MDEDMVYVAVPPKSNVAFDGVMVISDVDGSLRASVLATVIVIVVELAA